MFNVHNLVYVIILDSSFSTNILFFVSSSSKYVCFFSQKTYTKHLGTQDKDE